MKRLTGKSAIVLGATRTGSIGQAIATRLAHEGALVLVAGRQLGALESLARSLAGRACECDITRKPDLDRLVGTRLEANDLGEQGIRIDTISPG